MKPSRFHWLLMILWASILLPVFAYLLLVPGSINSLILGWVAFALAFSAILLRILTHNDRNRIDALTNALRNLRDSDYSVSLAEEGRDEVDELLAQYNLLTEKLRQERQRLYQRELLLDSVIENASLALVLLDQNGVVIYSNTHASHMFNRGRAINGLRFDSFRDFLPEKLFGFVESESSGILSIEHEGEAEQYHVSVGNFNFHASQHKLLMVKQLTRELNRQEVAVWRKVIRVISHELNNSLAPISSMAHSAKIAVEKQKPETLLQALDTIADRAQHLSEFVGGYAKLAKLPEPQIEDVDLETFFAQLQSLVPFQMNETLPTKKLRFDPRQMQQVILNLLKNAHESDSKPEDIELSLRFENQSALIDIKDKGCGMSKEVLSQAVLPFYTTKSSGSGVGLSLCREIIQQHNGQLIFRNRENGGLCVSIVLPRTQPG
jgi:two-component system, NtrC family, nitrogen regulation sensor histidine kinase NtrY